MERMPVAVSALAHAMARQRSDRGAEQLQVAPSEAR
jgi:hypothetical protein